MLIGKKNFGRFRTDTIDFGNSSTQWLIISCHVQTPYVNGRKVKHVIIES